MTPSTKYTFEFNNTPFAKDHALHCLSMRPDDFVEYGKLANQDVPTQAKQRIHSDPTLNFILAYENGQLMNQVGGVRIVDEGRTVFVEFGFSAPVNGGLSYVYGNLFLELLRFLSSEGYSKFSAGYHVGQSADKLFLYFSQAFPQYNFTFEKEGTRVTLTIDLVNLREG